MRLCVIAGMIDAKLAAKISPLQNIPEVERIDLIRRSPFSGDKIICHCPPFSWLPFAETYRLFTLLIIATFRRPDFLISFGTVPHGIYSWWIGRAFGIPVIQHVMGKNDIRTAFPRQWGHTLTLAAISAGVLVAVRGQQMKNLLVENKVVADQIFIPQNVHDFELFRPLSVSNPTYDLIYVGLLEPYKRLDILLDAFALLLRKRADASLLIVGDGSQKRSLKYRARRLNIENRVTFTGRTEFRDIPNYLRQAKIFVMTSQGEGLPQALIEAFSCGLPAVIYADADIPELAIDGVNALLVDRPEADIFSVTLGRLLDDSSLYAQLRRGALELRAAAQNLYSVDYQSNLWRNELIAIGGLRQQRVLAICGMEERKLRQKLAPLQSLQTIDEIYLVRRLPFEAENIRPFCPPEWCRNRALLSEIWKLLMVLKLCVTHPPDVLVCMTLLPHGIPALVSRFFFNIPMITHVMGHWEISPAPNEHRWTASIRHWVLRCADVALVRGQRSRHTVHQVTQLPRDRILIQHNVFDFSLYESVGPQPHRYDLIFIGNLEPNKHLHFLIEIVSRLHLINRKIRLVVIGDGPLRDRLPKLSRSFNVSQYIDFVGTRNELEIIQLLKSSKLLVLTSLGEGVPQVVVEAFACNVPAIVFDSGDVNEIVRHRENGILVEPLNIDAFVKEVDNVLHAPGELDRLISGTKTFRSEHEKVCNISQEGKMWTSALNAAKQIHRNFLPEGLPKNN